MHGMSGTRGESLNPMNGMEAHIFRVWRKFFQGIAHRTPDGDLSRNSDQLASGACIEGQGFIHVVKRTQLAVDKDCGVLAVFPNAMCLVRNQDDRPVTPLLE